MFGTVDKDVVAKNVKVGDSYILRGLDGKVRVEDLVFGVDSKEGLNEKYCNRRREREEEGNQKVGMVQNWELGMEGEHEGIHSQCYMGMKMKDCCDCPYDVQYCRSIRVLHMHVNWYRVLQFAYELVDKFLYNKQNIPESCGFFTTNTRPVLAPGGTWLGLWIISISVGNGEFQMLFFCNG